MFVRKHLLFTPKIFSSHNLSFKMFACLTASLLFISSSYLSAAESSKSLSPEEKAFNEAALDLKNRLIQAKASYKAPRNKDVKLKFNPNESVFIIRGKSSTGSGFYANLWGIPVGITNAHVIATMKNPKILDGKGKSYKLKSMLAMPERDIVIFELKNAEGIKPLPVMNDVSVIKINTDLKAYGNSQGQGVITCLNGKLQGIGPKKIEISATIVPGNSGGPVISQNKIIGVSTYLYQRRRAKSGSNSSPLDSNFWGRFSKIRRFGTRIDSINPAIAEVLNPVSTAIEVEMVQDLKEANLNMKTNIIESIKQQLKARKVRSQAEYYAALMQILKNSKTSHAVEKCYSKINEDPTTYKCNNMVVARQLDNQLAIFRSISSFWDIQEVFSCRDPKFQKDFFEALKHLKRFYQKPPRCKECKGSGFKLIELKYQFKDNSGARGIAQVNKAYRTLRFRCPFCSGTGFQDGSRYYYKLVNRKLAVKYYKRLDLSFLGFRPGSSWYGSRGATRKLRFAEKRRSDINDTYFYSKNPRFPQSKSTKLNFVFGRLQEIKIFFPYSKETYSSIKKKIEDKYGKFTWESPDHASFCQMNTPEYNITIGQNFTINKNIQPEKQLFVSCKHKALSNAKFLFNQLRRTGTKPEKFAIKKKKKKSGGF